MPDLDLTLRSPGRVLLLERGHAQAIVDRGLEERRGSGGASLISRAMGAISRIGRPKADRDDDDDGPDRSKLAMPSIAWAKTVEFGEGYLIVDGIAVLDVSGVLTPHGYYDFWTGCWYGGYAQIGAAISAAREDDRVSAVLMRVDSPGGLVDGCFDLAELIASGNAKAGGKPVWVFATMACSAAYALACAADKIVAASEADVGSIGVVVTHYDVSGWYAELGIKVEAIQSGASKTDGAEWKPLTPDARAHLQSVVDQVARRFVKIVSANRGLAAEAITGLEAKWFLAQHDDATQSGEKLGLVDQIASERACFAALISSLSGETETGAPAETGEDAARSAARAGTTKENGMSLKEQIDALRAKASKGDKNAIAELNAMGVPVSAESTETDDDDEEAAAEETAEETETEDEDDDDDKEPQAKATGTKAGFALLACKEAKGRDDLARKLARKVGSGKLTYGEAKDMLAAAPKGSRLGAAMEGRDHNPGHDGPSSSKAGAGLGAAVDRMLEAKKK